LGESNPTRGQGIDVGLVRSIPSGEICIVEDDDRDRSLGVDPIVLRGEL